jgi:Fe2+ transport system protein FeoA
MRNKNLAETEQGKTVAVLTVTASGPHGVRLAGLGILPGERVTVLRNGRRRSLLLECGRTLIALARPLAETVSVEEGA